MQGVNRIDLNVPLGRLILGIHFTEDIKERLLINRINMEMESRRSGCLSMKGWDRKE